MQMLVNIDVNDLQAATDFYSAAFGFRVGRRLGTDIVEMLGDPLPIYLLCKTEGSSPSPRTAQARDYQRHWSPVHLDFVVTDIDVAIARVIAAGAIQETAIAVSNWGKLAEFADPFGHGFCLVEFIGRGYDEIAL